MPLDFFSQVQEATYTPSPLVGLLQDPHVVRSLTRRRSRSRSARRPSTSGPDRDRREDKENDSMNVFTVVLAEEERQVNHLRALLRTTAERLEDERVRANQAENRADFNESRVRELQMKLTNSEATKHSADLETERARDESHRLKMQMEMLEREVQRLRNSLSNMTKRKDDAEREASDAHDASRKAEQRLREYEAEQEGRDEGRRLASKKNYDNGWRECWPVAHEDGRTQGYEEGHGEGFTKGRADAKLTFYEEGRKKGKLEGYQEGLERGTREERDRALQEFDKFLEEEVSASVHERVSCGRSVLASTMCNDLIARPSTTLGFFSCSSGGQNARTAQQTAGHELRQHAQLPRRPRRATRNQSAKTSLSLTRARIDSGPCAIFQVVHQGLPSRRRRKEPHAHHLWLRTRTDVGDIYSFRFSRILFVLMTLLVRLFNVLYPSFDSEACCM